MGFRSRCVAAALAAAFVLAPGGLACGSRGPRAEAHGVLVVAIDALRADHLGFLGYDRDTSPALGQLAKDGLVFRDAFASAPQLLPAHVALLTGCEPTVARRFLVNEFEGLTERRWSVPERGPHLAVEFLAAGYATAAFVDDPQLSEVHGFAPGFQRYEVLEEESAEDWEGAQTARIVDHFLTWLRGLEPGRSWFAYLHFDQLDRFWSDPRPPGEGFFQPRAGLDIVPPVGNTDSVFFAVPRSRWHARHTLGEYEAAYDDEIRGIDRELERLCASLRRLGRFDATTLHVLGSYGLQFGEAGLYLCAGRYSRADLAVPWIVRPRKDLALACGRTIDGLVSLVDLAPTVLDLEGLSVPGGMHGKSQARALRDPLAPVAERSYVYASCGVQEGCALIGPRYALEWFLPRGTADAQLRRSWLGVWDGKPGEDHGLEPRLVFYDRRELAYPPLDGEERPGPEPEFQSMRAAAVEWLRDMNDARLYLQAAAGQSRLGPAVLEHLRAKGYVGAEP